MTIFLFLNRQVFGSHVSSCLNNAPESCLVLLETKPFDLSPLKINRTDFHRAIYYNLVATSIKDAFHKRLEQRNINEKPAMDVVKK